jgi:hypothetical protein
MIPPAGARRPADGPCRARAPCAACRCRYRRRLPGSAPPAASRQPPVPRAPRARGAQCCLAHAQGAKSARPSSQQPGRPTATATRPPTTTTNDQPPAARAGPPQSQIPTRKSRNAGPTMPSPVHPVPQCPAPGARTGWPFLALSFCRDAANYVLPVVDLDLPRVVCRVRARRLRLSYCRCAATGTGAIVQQKAGRGCGPRPSTEFTAPTCDRGGGGVRGSYGGGGTTAGPLRFAI